MILHTFGVQVGCFGCFASQRLRFGTVAPGNQAGLAPPVLRLQDYTEWGLSVNGYGYRSLQYVQILMPVLL